jgi:CheY-like chemotaxis protein
MPGGDISPVKMDPSQLDQILANLCVNSKDAMAKGGSITIRTENVFLDEDYCSNHAGFVPGDYVMLSVRDDGCGMEKETLDHIFEPFFTTKEVGKGTGLGLSTVYGIVKQNNGFISVYSEPGKGTAIKIYLPPQRPAILENKHSAGSGIARGNNETILLVEDDRGILDITHNMLERLGYKVLPAQSPQEALALSKRHQAEINLLMTDVVMPGMDGKELAARLKAESPGLRTLFMSGYTAEVVVKHGILDKGVKFISKPFSVAELSLALRDILESAI